jgi:hypothetical protein
MNCVNRLKFRAVFFYSRHPLECLRAASLSLNQIGCGLIRMSQNATPWQKNSDLFRKRTSCDSTEGEETTETARCERTRANNLLAFTSGEIVR